MAKSDEELLQQISQLGAAVNAARDESLDPELRALADHTAQEAAGRLSEENQ
ncbi:hypothetical protein [Streptomyces sp. NPDC088348]|uniref:hypothetical protein n=1 Tax=Streptomyces sp. NPDC088348 TaxID=3365853 RepID=UPI0037FBB4E3